MTETQPVLALDQFAHIGTGSGDAEQAGFVIAVEIYTLLAFLGRVARLIEPS
jgi:hypothetical protein